MYFIDISPSAVVLAALIPLLLGSFWYSPTVFGNHWLRLTGINTDNIKQARLAVLGAFLGSFAASLVMSFILAALIQNLFIYTVFDGMLIGFYMWVGFVATTTLPEYLFGGNAKPYLLYVLTNGYHLLSLVIMAALLTMWL